MPSADKMAPVKKTKILKSTLMKIVTYLTDRKVSLKLELAIYFPSGRLSKFNMETFKDNALKLFFIYSSFYLVALQKI